MAASLPTAFTLAVRLCATLLACLPAVRTTLQLSGTVAGSFAFDGKARATYLAALRAKLPGGQGSRTAGAGAAHSRQPR